MRPAVVLLSAVTLLMSLGGCGHDAAEGEHVDKASRVVLSDSGHRTVDRLYDGMDYRAYGSPEELLRNRTSAFYGEVMRVAPGVSIVSETEDGFTRDNSVVVTVHVLETFADADHVASEGRINVSLPRGINSVDANGSVLGTDPNPTVQDVEKALPRGLRVVVVSQPRDLEVETSAPDTYIGTDPATSAETVLLEGAHPQTISFDRGERILDAWPDLTFDELLAALKATRPDASAK